VIVWGEIDSSLLHSDRFININKVVQMPKSTFKGYSEAVETSRLVQVTIWGETDGLLLSRDRPVKINKVAQTQMPKPTLQ